MCSWASDRSRSALWTRRGARSHGQLGHFAKREDFLRPIHHSCVLLSFFSSHCFFTWFKTVTWAHGIGIIKFRSDFNWKFSVFLIERKNFIPIAIPFTSPYTFFQFYCKTRWALWFESFATKLRAIFHNFFLYDVKRDEYPRSQDDSIYYYIFFVLLYLHG